MSGSFVSFDDARRRAVESLNAEALPEAARPLYLVRNLFGKVRISVSEAVEADESCRDALRRLADRLCEALGAHGCPPANAVLFVEPAVLADLNDTAREVAGLDQVYWVDRLMTGGGWWTVNPPDATRVRSELHGAARSSPRRAAQDAAPPLPCSHGIWRATASGYWSSIWTWSPRDCRRRCSNLAPSRTSASPTGSWKIWSDKASGSSKG